MKKLLTFILLAFASGLFAQSKVRLGIALDPVVTWFSPKNQNLSRDGARPGVNGGLIVEAYWNDNYAFATGLSIGVMGGNLVYEDSVTIIAADNEKVILNPGTTVAYNLTYITLPVSVKMKTNEIGYMRYFAQLGFAPQVNSGSRANSTGELLNKDFVGKEINLFHISYFIGAGIEYGIGGQTALTAGLFFHNGFTDVLSNNSYRAQINYLAIRMGVIF